MRGYDRGGRKCELDGEFGGVGAQTWHCSLLANFGPMLFTLAMDALPEASPAYEQIITAKLKQCGLSSEAMRIIYDEDVQSHVIFIARSAKVTLEMFQCIRDAAGAAIVTFEDDDLERRFSSFLHEELRPKIIADAEVALSRLGLLRWFPRRENFASDALFAEALEEHCGIPTGKAIRPFKGTLALQPPLEDGRDGRLSMESYSCLVLAIMLVNARDEMKISLIGNEAVASPD